MIAMPDPYGYKVCSHEEAEPFHRARQEHEVTLENYFRGLVQMDFADDKEDMVNSPSHYTQGSIECIDAIAQVVKDLQGMEAMCTGNAIKYLWRWKHKNGIEDIKKAQWYLQRMIDNYTK
jgi:Protein of unknwon function (DUF3310)